MVQFLYFNTGIQPEQLTSGEKLMKNTIVLVSILAVCFSASAFAQEKFATKKEAEAMVVKTVAALKANQAKTLEEITAKDPKYIDRDLYAVVYDMSGKVLAHGANSKMVGKDLIDLKDPDGKEFVKERVELANSKGKFWQEYKFTDPETRRMLPKEAYCEKAGNAVVCAGVYKR
ncbi:MAG: histidine kinase [Candidatus Gallionella acididurans]|uniref:Histidine kinase n=1 Tax=Candidatus Gallionella acididurans TaxID=1796491 RepID=A0A139BYD5_9PROT|nr:MAG: histidine kinase [Candidatus Gallionella acididurans]